MAGGYRLSAGSELPPLLRDDAEAVAVAVGLRTAASGSVAGIEETSVRALAKLEQVLPSRLRRRVSALGDATWAFGIDGPQIDADLLVTLAGACRDSARLQFAYVARDDKTTKRSAEPAAVVYSGYRWYHAPASEAGPRIPKRYATVEPDGEDACIVATVGSWTRSFLVWTALLDAPVEVLDPPELAEAARTLVARLTAAT